MYIAHIQRYTVCKESLQHLNCGGRAVAVCRNCTGLLCAYAISSGTFDIAPRLHVPTCVYVERWLGASVARKWYVRSREWLWGIESRKV